MDIVLLFEIESCQISAFICNMLMFSYIIMVSMSCNMSYWFIYCSSYFWYLNMHLFIFCKLYSRSMENNVATKHLPVRWYISVEIGSLFRTDLVPFLEPRLSIWMHLDFAISAFKMAYGNQIGSIFGTKLVPFLGLILVPFLEPIFWEFQYFWWLFLRYLFSNIIDMISDPMIIRCRNRPILQSFHLHLSCFLYQTINMSCWRKSIEE